MDNHVYLVMCWNYADSSPCSIWSTREAATTEAERLKSGPGYGEEYEVLEFPLDDSEGVVVAP